MNRITNTLLSCLNYSIIVLGAMELTSCVDLSGAKYHSQLEKHPTTATSQIKSQPRLAYNGEVHTMLGGLGLFSTGMKVLRDSVDTQYHIPASSDMWYNAGNVSRKIITYYQQHPGSRPIILVGHSLGANEQIKVARNLDKAGIPVDLLVTVDAVSQTRVPGNVKHVMNFYKHGYVPMLSGLRVVAINPAQTKVENIDVTALKGVQVNHFTIDKDPAVQAMIMAEVKKVVSHNDRVKTEHSF